MTSVQSAASTGQTHGSFSTERRRNEQGHIHCQVADLLALLQALRSEGCNVLEKTDDSEYGKFGWVMDSEGNKVELWQPPEGQ